MSKDYVQIQEDYCITQLKDYSYQLSQIVCYSAWKLEILNPENGKKLKTVTKEQC